MKNSRIVATRSNRKLAEEVCAKLEMPLTEIMVVDFPDSEIYVEVCENIRRDEVFIISGCTSNKSGNKNSDIMELMLLIDAVRRSSPSRIVVIFPYYPYARQDRRTNRSPISSKVFANMLCHSGIDSVICMDLHSLQTQGFFNNNVVCEHMSALKAMKEVVAPNHDWDMVVSSDIGGTSRARYFSNLLNLPIAIIDKRRPEAGKSEVMNVIGNVEGKKCVLVDDMVDGAGTLVGAADALEGHGAKSIDAICVHGLFSGDAIKKIKESNLNKLYVTDSIEHGKGIRETEKIEILTIRDLVAETIRRSCNGESLKALVT
jgi:ribose-phosphate pyrophosphokinase